MCRLLAAALLAASALAPRVATPVADAPSGAYLEELLGEINARRAKAGTAPLAYVAPAANEAVGRYLADLTPMMLAYHACFHGTGDPVAPVWDYVAMAGVESPARGEVLGCPLDGFSWSPRRIADGWWGSPSHFRELYGDPSANAVACGAYGAGRDGYQTVACVTYRI